MAEKFPEQSDITDSTIRILLLGRCGSGKSSSGNTILGQNIFKSPKRYKEKVTRTCEEHSCDVAGMKVCVIDTPDLLDPDLTEDQLNQEKDKLLSLCQSGLHAVLLVLPIGKDLQNEEEILEFSNELFGLNIQRYTISLFTREDKLEEDETIEKHIEDNLKLKQLIDGCSGQNHVFNNKHHDENQVEELLEKIDGLVKNNEGTFLIEQRRRNSTGSHVNFSGVETCSELNKDSTELFEQLYESQSQLRVVLLGKTGSGKSLTGNTILGRNLFKTSSGSKSETKECSSQRIYRAGREIVVVDTPGLFDRLLSSDAVKKEIGKCLTFISPGPHVFLIVIRIGRFTPEEFKTICELEKIFGSEATKYTMILFTHQDGLKNETIEEYIENGDSKLREFVRKCRNRYLCFNNEKPSFPQFKELLGKIDEMSKDAGPERYYTNQAFKRAEKEIKNIQSEIFNYEMLRHENTHNNSPLTMQTISRNMQKSREEAETKYIIALRFIVFAGMLTAVMFSRNICVIQ